MRPLRKMNAAILFLRIIRYLEDRLVLAPVAVILVSTYEIAALLRRNRMSLQMWRQSGLGLRQFGQKDLVPQKIAFIGVWEFGRHLDLGAADLKVREKNGKPAHSIS